MSATNGSMKMRESGHPCLVPVYSVKGCDVCPFVMTVAEGAVYSILIQLISDSQKQNLCSIVKRNPVYPVKSFFCI